MTMSKSSTTVMHELADRIRALRLRKKWTRETLADHSDVNVYSLKRFERTGQISWTLNKVHHPSNMSIN